MKVVIKSGSFSWAAVIYDTPTGKLIYQALPLKGAANLWGGEIYFALPVEAALESGASDIISRGDLCYWPTGKAFCIFFGSTPVSKGGEIRAASAVNVFGRIEGRLGDLSAVNDGDEVVVEPARG